MPGPRTARLLSLAAAVVFLVYIIFVAWPAARRTSYGFIAYYTASVVLVSAPQNMPRVYDGAWFEAQTLALSRDGSRDIFNVQPPAMSLIALPLVWLSPAAARAAWIGFSLLCLTGGLLLLAHALQVPWMWALWLTPVCLFTAPVTQNIRVAQVYLFLFFLLCLVFDSLVRSEPGPQARREPILAAGGFALGLLLVLKTAALWLWPLLLAGRRVRFTAWGALTAGAVALISMPRIGLLTWQTYLGALSGLLTTPLRHVVAYQTVSSLIGHLFVYDATANPMPLVDLPFLALPLTLAIELGAFWVTLRRARLQSSRHEVRVLSVALLMSLVAANAPLGEGYHAVLVLPSLLAAWWWWVRSRPGVGSWIVLGLATFLLTAPLPYDTPFLRDSWWALLAYPRVAGAYGL